MRKGIRFAPVSLAHHDHLTPELKAWRARSVPRHGKGSSARVSNQRCVDDN